MRSLPVTLSLLFAIFLSFDSSAKFLIPSDDKVINRYGSYMGGEELDPQSIKVLVWNMYKGELPSWREDFLTLSENKDVLLLQEVSTSQLMLETFPDSGFGIEMVTSFINTKENLASGVASASKVKPVKVFYQRSIDREPFIKTPKMVSFTEFKLKNEKEKIVFISIHALNFVSTSKFNRQIGEVEKYLKTWKGYVVWGGDFNTWSKSKLKKLKEVARRLGLNEVIFDESNDLRMTVFGNKLDYIFTKGLRSFNATVHGEIEGSDHKALEVELAVDHH